MEIIKTYTTRRSTRGSTNPPPPTPPAPAPPETVSAPDTSTPNSEEAPSSSTVSSSTTSTSSPAISSPGPVAIVPTITTRLRRSTGRAVRTVAAESSTQSAQILPISEESAKKEDNVIANLPANQSSVAVSVRASTRSRRGSSSSSSSNTTSAATQAAKPNANSIDNTIRRRSGRAAAKQELLKAKGAEANTNSGNQQRTPATSEKNGTENANVTVEPKDLNGKSNVSGKRERGEEARVLESSSTSAQEVTDEQEKAEPEEKTPLGTPSLQLLEIERSIIAREAARLKAKEELPPAIVLVDRLTESSGVDRAASSEEEDVSSVEDENSRQLSKIHLTVTDDGKIYVNPDPDAPVIEDGETFTVELPTNRLNSPSSRLHTLPTAPPQGRSRKTKPQAITYGGETSVGFLDSSGVTMEVGQHLHRAKTLRQAALSEPSIVMTLESQPGDVTSSSTIVSLEVPAGSIDPNDFESHLDPHSLAALETVLQSDQGREILSEALGGMGVVTVSDSGEWSQSYSGGKEEAVVSSSAGLTSPTSIESPTSTTVGVKQEGSQASPASHRGPGRPPGRPSSSGGRGRPPATPPVVNRKVSESENIRRSQRQQDKFERQEAERIREENQQMLQREKEEMQAALQQQQQQVTPMSSPPMTPKHQHSPHPNVGVVTSTQITPVQSAGPSTPNPSTPVDRSGIDSTTEGGGSGRRPIRARKLPAHLADPNMLSLEDATSAVKEMTRRLSTQQDSANASGEESNVASPAAKVVPHLPSNPPSIIALDESMEVEDEDQIMTEEEDYTDDDPNKLWCICRQPHNNRFMICCDRCEDWFHGKCVNITKAQGKKMELNNMPWNCPKCKAKLREERGGGSKQQQRRQSIKEKSPEKTGLPRGRKPSETPQASPTKKESSPSGNGKGSKPTAKSLALKAEVEAAQSVAISAEPPSKIAAAALGKRGRTKSERGEGSEEPSTSGTSCVICKKPARSGSVYCSDLCVQKYADNVKSSPSKERPTSLMASPSAAVATAQTPTTPGGSDSGKSPTKQLKRSSSTKDAADSFFNFHVIGSGTSVSTEVVPPKPKELTASQILKAQKEKVHQEKTPPKTPSTPPQGILPTVVGISPSSVSAIVNSKPNVVVKKMDDSSKGMNIASASASSDPSEQDGPVSCSEKPERKRTSSVSTTDSGKSHSSSSKSKERLERRESSQKSDHSKLGPSSERLHRESMRKTLKETLKNRSAELSSSDKKKMEAAGNSPDSVGLKIEQELTTLFGGASTPKCKNKYRSIWFNLKNEKNSIFRELLLGNVKAFDLVRMTPEQMAPSDLAQWRKQEEEKGLEAIKRAELDKLAEAKKQELIDKGVEDAVQVAEESKPLDISDVIVDPDEEKKKEHKKDKSSHHHRDHHSHHRDKDREVRRSDRDKDHKSSRDKDKHRHSEREKDKKEKERHSSSSSRHKSSHHKKDKERSRSDRERDKERERSRTDREKDKERRSERHKEKDKVKNDKEKERSEREKSSRHTRSTKDSEKEKDRNKEKEKSKSPEESPKAVEDVKEKEKEKTSLEEVKMKSQEGTKPTEASPPTVTTTTASTVSSPTPPQSTVVSEVKVEVKEEVRHPSIDSEQELPSSTIKTPDFAEDSSSASSGKKEGEPGVFQSTIAMPELGEFKALFHNVSHEDGTLKGACFPESPVPIVGRINPQTVWEYIDKMKKTKEIITFRLTPASPADAKGYMTFFSYLSSRERLGVIGGLCHPLKDVYLVPLDKHQPVPRCLLPFAGAGLPHERTHCLLAVVTRHAMQGLKRKISAGVETAKKKTKLGGGERSLRSERKQESESQSAPEPVDDKGDDNEPYTPWEEEDEGSLPVSQESEVEQRQLLVTAMGVAESAAGEADIKAQLREIEERIAKEKQSIDSILAGAKNVVGIPGLDGDFPEGEEEDSKEGIATEPASSSSVPSTSKAQGSAVINLDPRSTRSSIFKTQPALPSTPHRPVWPMQVQISPQPPNLLQQSNIPGLDSSRDDSCSPPILEPEMDGKAMDTKEDSEEAYSPSALNFSDEDSPPVVVLDEMTVPVNPVGHVRVSGSGDIDERQMVMSSPPSLIPILPCGDIDERVGVGMPEAISTVADADPRSKGWSMELE